MAQASRRTALVLLSSALGATATGAWWPAHGGDLRGAAARAQLARLLEATFSDLEAARILGKRCLARHAVAAPDALALADRLIGAHPTSAADVRRALAQRRADDARRRALVLVDGWILPKAEAEACALTVLL